MTGRYQFFTAAPPGPTQGPDQPLTSRLPGRAAAYRIFTSPGQDPFFTPGPTPETVTADR